MATQPNLSPKSHHDDDERVEEEKKGDDDERAEQEKKGNVVIEWKWIKKRDLGSGSYGVVYLAELVVPELVEASKKIIAVKSSKPHLEYALEKEATILQSFVHCQEIIQCINGKHIITSLESGNSVQNLLLEYAPHGSLGDLINKGQITEHEARMYTCMILEGLVRIHGKGIVHCDLKPNNILLFNPLSKYGARHHLKIADFGLSKFKDEDLNAEPWKTVFRSTPSYMSPEAVKGEIDTPMDIWSLGCIVIEMITGSRQWYNKVSTKCKFGFLKEAPKLPDELSEDCKDFLSKCLVINPSQRWSADMLLNHRFPYKWYDFLEELSKYPKDLTSLFSYEF